MRVDLHCDSLTSKPPFAQLNPYGLRAEKAFQCFAAFTEKDEAAAYAAAEKLFYETFTPEKGFKTVKSFSDLIYARKHNLACCALTCENIGFTGGVYGEILRLKKDGVIMASLVWNKENLLAFPNVRSDGKREKRGLKKAGFEALEALKSLKIIVDISHLSDGGAEQVLRSGAIVVASHSGCNAVCRNARNLTDSQLKKIALAGGVVGINFYEKFLGGDGGFAAVAAHLKHIVKVAGEDTPAFGSDWDGAPADKIKITPKDLPALYEYLKKEGFSPRILDKLYYKNFIGVLKRTESRA